MQTVLMVTHDDVLWQHWRRLNLDIWLPARGRSLTDMHRWQEQGRRLVVLDAGMPGLPPWTSPSWAPLMRDLFVVVASMRPNDEEGKRVLMSGAKGYIHAYMPVSAIETVLKTVQDGGVWMGPTLLARLLRQIDNGLPRSDSWSEGLTAREKEVAERAAIGHSNQAIADALGITERTVRAHLSAVFQKLDVNDRLLLALRVHGINEHSQTTRTV